MQGFQCNILIQAFIAGFQSSLSMQIHNASFQCRLSMLMEAITAALNGSSQYRLPLWALNPLRPHGALKHHFTSPLRDLIFQQLRLL